MSPRSYSPGRRGIMTRLRAHRPDFGMLVAIYALLLWGVIVIYSIGPVLARATDISVTKQVVAVTVSTLAFWMAAKASPNFWRKTLPLMISVAIITTLLLLVPGGAITDSTNGATRWLELFGISFQPSELLKLALVMYFAFFLATRIRRNQITSRKSTLVPIGIILAVTTFFVTIMQKDLGTMMVISAIVFVMLFVSGLPKKDLVILGLIGLLTISLMIAIAPHRLQRVTTFISPEGDPTGSGYHIQQSLIAIGSGGLTGRGVGQSVQAFGYLPEAANDSIFAIHAETVGFIGVFVLLLLFGYLLRRIQLQSIAAGNEYNRLIIIGIFTWLLSHIIINVGAMLGLVPVTGITLPLISYGGSSMVLTMIALGIVFQLSHYSHLGIINSETRASKSRRT
jgi:cell division protein FtsW